LKLGEEDIAAVVPDPRSRDDIPQLLRGPQHIYTATELRDRVFAILAGLRPPGGGEDGKARPETGRLGLSQWAILVLGVQRLGLNADDDRILELANQYTTLRKMLGHADWADDTLYTLQTLKDNVSLFARYLLDRINQDIMRAGHAPGKKSGRFPAVRFLLLCRRDPRALPDRHQPALRRRAQGLQTRAGRSEDAGLSVFQPHTEWIRKGKAGVPVELGLRVAIGEDQHGFILHHRVMERITDDQVAVPLVEATVARFPTVGTVSMDKGFHRPANQRALAEVIDFPVLPKKGKCSAAERAREGDPRFIHLRRKHSAVESAINALEVHGPDR
jgi:hypothetical protein